MIRCFPASAVALPPNLVTFCLVTMKAVSWYFCYRIDITHQNNWDFYVENRGLAITQSEINLFASYLWTLTVQRTVAPNCMDTAINRNFLPENGRFGPLLAYIH